MPALTWIMAKLRRFVPVLTGLALLIGMTALNIVTTAPAGADATHQAVIGMPFTGNWAYNIPTAPNASCGPSNSQTSHPSCHLTNPSTGYLWGDWATDLFAAKGTVVKLEVPYATGSLSFSWGTSTGCGQSRVVNVSVGGVSVGSIYYDHINNAASTSSPPTNGMTVGTVHAWPSGCNPGPHVHFELKNATDHACYVNYSTSAHAAGMVVSQSDDLGVLGSTNTGKQQECTSVPTGGSGNGSGGVAPSLTGDVAAVNEANGTEELFYVGGNNAVWYRWQNSDGSWSPEHTISAYAKAITAVKMPDGRVEIFYVGGDNAIWYRWQTAPNTDSWSAEHTFAAGASQITSMIEPDGRIGVFYIGGDNAIYYRWQNTDGTWTAEERLQAGLKAISATKTSDGRIELVYIGGNNAVFYRAQAAVNTDTWTAESTLPAGGSAITSIAQANGLEEVFYIGGDLSIWYRWRNADGTWSAERNLSASAHAITSANTSDGRVQLFYVGGDNQIWSRWQTAPNTDTWSAETKIGGGVG